jgi:hypothetical protein
VESGGGCRGEGARKGMWQTENGPIYGVIG